MIRPATPTDAAQITDIYNYYLIHTTSTLEIEPVSYDEIASRIDKVINREKLPYYVFEESGEILGYAYATTWRTRVGYRYSVESSVYVKSNAFQKNIGRQLYEKVIDDLRKSGFKNVIGVLTLPNPTSVAFHEKLGFVKAGHFPKVGYKFDKWHDVGFWQLSL